MAGAAYKDFAELISVGERIEVLAKAGKLSASNVINEYLKKEHYPKEIEFEVSNVHHQQPFPPYKPSFLSTNRIDQASASHHQPLTNISYEDNHLLPPYPYTLTHPLQVNFLPTSSQNLLNHLHLPTNSQKQKRFHPRPPPFLELSISNAELFQSLFDANLVAESPLHPMLPSFPAWYNPNVTCKFHMGAVGHSIEDCEGFNNAVRRLLACGRLDIQGEGGLNISCDSLPNC